MVARTDRAASRKERDDLVFRHRSLVAAREILEQQYERAASRPKKDQLTIERLRRLRAYVINAIAAIERAMDTGSAGRGCMANGPPLGAEPGKGAGARTAAG